MAREVELKLELEPGASALLKKHELLAGGPGKAADQVSTYFDTPDGKLRTAGFSLRVREAKGKFVQTVKRAEGASVGLLDRPEWETEIRAGEIDFAALAETPLGPLLGKKQRRKLEKLIRVDVVRSVW